MIIGLLIPMVSYKNISGFHVITFLLNTDLFYIYLLFIVTLGNIKNTRNVNNYYR